jgi:hypothetical protein
MAGGTELRGHGILDVNGTVVGAEGDAEGRLAHSLGGTD